MTTLFDLLTKTDKEIEFVVKFDYRDPDTDAESSLYFSKLGSVPATGSGDTPANEDFPQFILDIGPSTDELSEDLLFSGKGSAIRGSITLDNKPDGQNSGGPLDYLGNLSFSGRAVTVYGGEKGATFSTFEPIPGSGFTRQEPFFNEDDKTVSFEIQSIITEFSRPFKFNRFIGIPWCVHWLTSSGFASAPHIAAYDLTSFTLIHRFRAPTNPVALATLWLKQTASTNRNFYAFMNTLGQIECHASIGGTDQTLLSSSTDWADSQLNTIVWSLLDKTTTYLMINNVVIDVETALLTGSVNTQTASVSFGTNLLDGISLDIAIINTYLTPDEARSVTAHRVDPDTPGVVACWSCDDGTGATSLTDYSSNGNNASLNGVLNTDYEWEPSDLGMPEHAGLPVPASYGDYFNAPVRYHDTINERGYWRDDLNTTPSNDVIVKSRGAVLARPGDYSLDVDDIIAFVTEQDEPLTHDSIDNGANAYPRYILEYLCNDRGNIPSSQIETGYIQAVSRLIPSELGVFVDDEKQFADVILPILSGLGAHARENKNSKLIFHHLHPPVGPGPYNDEAVLEWIGGDEDKVNLGNIGNPSGNLSLACWFKSIRALNVPEHSVGTLICKAPASVTTGYHFFIDSDGSLKCTVAGVGSVATQPHFAKSGVEYFGFVSFDGSLDGLFLYAAERGKSLQQVAVTSGLTGIPTTGTHDLLIGNSDNITPHVGSITHAQVWGKAHTLAQAQNLMNVPPVGNEAFNLVYAPLNDGVYSGSTVAQRTGSTTGTIHGLCRWAPQLTLNFITGEGVGLDTRFSGYRQIMPAGRVNIKYDVNYAPMTQADIAAGVSLDDARKLKLPNLNFPLIRQDVEDDYKQTRAIELTSHMWRKPAVAFLANLLATRFGPNAYFGVVNDINRNGVLLELTDEVRIIHPSHTMSSGVHFRVVNRTNDELRTNINLWTLR